MAKKRAKKKKRAEPKRDAEQVIALKDAWDCAECSMQITCGGCSMITTFDFELGDDPTVVKQDAAKHLYDRGWRVMNSEHYGVLQELFCDDCIERGVPEKGD